MATPTPSRTKRTKKRRKKKHDRSRSEGFKHNMHCFHESRVPRKLGPIEIGRIKYKGTKYKESDTGHFLDEKISIHSRTSSFEIRRRNNPVPKRPSLKEIGTPNFWEKPTWFQSESDLMKREVESALDFLHDNKPMHVRDKKLDKLQNAHVPKGSFAQQEVAPFSWKPPSFDLHIDTTHFLSEKFWYEASKVGIDGEFAHALQTLTPEKLIKIKDIPPPTGYDTKINYLNQLRQIVFEDRKQNMSLTALQDGDEADLTDNTHEGRLLSPQVLNSPLNELNEDARGENDDNDESEFDKQMDAALEEILARSPSPLPPARAEIDDNEIDDALREILAPSPSPQPPENDQKEGIENVNVNELKRDRSAERRQLIKTIKKNLDDIQSTNDKEINTLSLDEARNCNDWKVNDVETRIDIDHIQKKYKHKKKKKKKKQINYRKTTNRAHVYKLDVLCEKKPININITKPMKRNNDDGIHCKYRSRIPSNYICPISMNIMNEAVMASDGRIYDKINMETWLKAADMSPVDGKRLRHKQLMPYSALTNEINAWKKVHALKKRRKKRRRRSPVLNTKQKQWNHKLPDNATAVSTSAYN